MAAAPDMGSIVLTIAANQAKLEKDMRDMSRTITDQLKTVDQQAQRVQRQINDIGAAGGGIRRIEGAREAANDIEKVGHASTGARRELLVLAHEISQGNFKRAAGSLMVLGERLDIMGAVMSPLGLAIGLATGAVALFTAAIIKGALESAAFNRSLMLTGNFAGQTEAHFNQMSRGVASAANVTIGEAREITQALISTGRFGPQSLNMVAIAAARLADVTGAKTEEVVKDMVKMSDGVLKWAVETNRQYHFVDGALYDHIRALEEQGRKEEAEQLAAKALYDHLGGEAVQNLGYLERAWKGVKGAISDVKDALLSIGRAETGAEKATELQARIAEGQARLAEIGPNAKGPSVDAMRKGLADNMRQLADVERANLRQDENASLAVSKTAHDAKVVEAKEYWNRLLETTRTGEETLKEERAKAEREGKLAGASDADIDAVKARITKRFQHGGNGAALARADLQSVLQPLQDQIKGEDTLLAYREQVLTKYYRAGLISQDGYYTTRETVIKANSERLKSLYGDEIAAVEAAANATAGAAKKKELINKANQLRAEEQTALLRSGEALSSMQLEQATDADKYRAEIEKLNAELGKLDRNQAASAGAEFDRTHAGIRKQATAANDTDALATLDAARAAYVAQAQMNQLKQQATDITTALGLAEKRVKLEEQTGIETVLGGEEKISQKRLEASAQLQNIATQMQEIAASSGLPTMVNQAEQFKLETDQMAASADVMGHAVTDTFANGFAQILDNTISRTKTLRQSFLDFANSIETSLTRLISQDLFNQLFSMGNGSGGAGTNWIGQLIGLAIGMMGGGAAGSENLGAASTSTPDDLIGGYTGRAGGGPVMRGGIYEVNENGPELLSYANRTFLMMGDQPGTVTPMGASNGGASNWHLNITVPAGTTRATAQQQARAIMEQAQIAQGRNS